MKRFTKGRLAAAGVVMAALSIMFFGTATADETGTVTVTVISEVLSIAVGTPGATISGAFPNGATVTISDNGDLTTLPTITNNGNVPINSLNVAYNGGIGVEADCDGGPATWAAHVDTAGTDVFTMAVVSSDADTTNDNGKLGTRGVNIPVGGAADAYDEGLEGTALLATEIVDLMIQLKTPITATVGSGGCIIVLDITATTS